MNQGTKGNEMSRKSLLKSESAAAIAIAAVLLLGLAFTMISVVKLNHAPEWKIDAERDYSYDAWGNMEDVKTRIDLFTRFMDSNSNYSGYGLSATVPFSMGGGDVPVFEPSKSNSKLSVNNEEYTMNITLANHSFSHKIDCGGVTYYSENRQYPDQVFRYENGALIMAQGESSQMKRKPSFDIQKIDNENYAITINAINLTGETTSVSSSTLAALRLTGCSINPTLNSSTDYLNESINSFNLSICTRYTDAWATYLNDTAKEAGLEYGTDYQITYPDSGCVCLSFLPTGNNYSIYVNKTIIGAEFGVGNNFNYADYVPGGGSIPNSNIMELNKPYYFNTVSITGIDLSSLRDCGSGADLSIQSTGQALSGYSQSSNIVTYNLKDSSFEPTFGFSGFTEFESQPSSATILMIYRPKFKEPDYQDTNISGKSLPELTGDKDDTWYLYKQATTNLSISDPSNLTYYIKIGKENGNKYIDIDYLAIYLS